MEEKRKDLRIEPRAVQIRGKLYNVVGFRIHDISEGGISILSNFMATVGQTYTVFLFENGQQQDFEIQVLRAEVDHLSSVVNDVFSPGLVLSISARFLNLSDERLDFLRSVLQKNSGEREIGCFPELPPPAPPGGEPPKGKRKKGRGRSPA